MGNSWFQYNTADVVSVNTGAFKRIGHKKSSQVSKYISANFWFSFSFGVTGTEIVGVVDPVVEFVLF
ncbi:hypothetical protein GW750_06370 [bacterium]|nr:hypothetical protein [bacterium]